MLQQTLLDLPEVYTEDARMGAGMAGIVYRVKRGEFAGAELVMKVIKKVKHEGGTPKERDDAAKENRTAVVRELQMLEYIRRKADGHRPAHCIRAYALFDSDIKSPNGNLYLVMGGYLGGNLASAIRENGHFNESDRDVRVWMHDLLTAVAFLHDERQHQGNHFFPMIHRDIKPANIIKSMGDDSHAYLADFGQAIVFETLEDPLLKKDPGHNIYMAPEFIKNRVAYTHPLLGYQPVAVKPAIDCWAIGITLCELLMGIGHTPLNQFECVPHTEGCPYKNELVWPAPAPVQRPARGQYQHGTMEFDNHHATLFNCADDVRINGINIGIPFYNHEFGMEPPAYNTKREVVFRLKRLEQQQQQKHHQQHHAGQPSKECECERNLELAILNGIRGEDLKDAFCALSSDCLDLLAGLLTYDSDNRLPVHMSKNHDTPCALSHQWFDIRQGDRFNPDNWQMTIERSNRKHKGGFYSPGEFYKNYYKSWTWTWDGKRQRPISPAKNSKMIVFIFDNFVGPDKYMGRTLFCAVAPVEGQELTQRDVYNFIAHVLLANNYWLNSVWMVQSPRVMRDARNREQLVDEKIPLFSRTMFIESVEYNK